MRRSLMNSCKYSLERCGVQIRWKPHHRRYQSFVRKCYVLVLKEDAAYTYNPVNHSLTFYKSGDWRDIVGYQYPGAPLVLGLCYNTTLANPNHAAVEIGEICQNIAFTVDALDLGAVVTEDFPQR